MSSIKLTPNLILQNALYIPNFRFNLISVNKLVTMTQAKFVFYPTHCLLQDLMTEENLIEGKVIGNLYVLIKHEIAKERGMVMLFKRNVIKVARLTIVL